MGKKTPSFGALYKKKTPIIEIRRSCRRLEGGGTDDGMFRVF